MQNRRSSKTHIVYFVFDILMYKDKDLAKLPLSKRREVLRTAVQSTGNVSVSEWTSSVENLLRFVHEHQLEGIVAKQTDSIYQPGKRPGSWVKVQIHRSQEFVIGGYTPSHLGLDALIVGFYRGKDLMFAARVRAGFTPHSRRAIYNKIRHLETSRCPFANLPDKHVGQWGQGITAEKMKDCTWLLCRIRHRSHYVECRTMPHRRIRSCHHCIERYFVRHNQSEFSCRGTPIAIPLLRTNHLSADRSLASITS